MRSLRPALQFASTNIAVAILILSAISLSAAAQTSSYHVIKRIPIAGDTGWDYITADSAARRLYVPHGVEVVVLDLDSEAIVGKVTGLRDAHGVAVAPEFGRGFVDATDPGSVIIFDLKTLAAIDKLRIGDDPNGIIYDLFSDPTTRSHEGCEFY